MKLNFDGTDYQTRSNSELLKPTELKRAKYNKEQQQRRDVKTADKILSGSTNIKEDLGDGSINKDEILAEPKIKPVTVQQLQLVASKNIGSKALIRATELINEAVEQEEYSILGLHVRDNFLGWISALDKVGRVSMDEYLSAVKFVTYKLAGDSNIRAYTKTFPDRVQRMEDENQPMSYLSSYASIYGKSKLVTEITALTIVPSHIMYHSAFDLAVQTQMELMTDASISPKVRSDAANSLLTHLKQPESKKLELDVGIKENSAISQLSSLLDKLGENQVQSIISGSSTVRQVSKEVIYDVDYEESHE